MQDSNWISHFMSTKLAPGLIPDLSESDREQMERVLTTVLASLQQYPEAHAAVVAGFNEIDFSELGSAPIANAKTTKRTQEVIDNKQEMAFGVVGSAIPLTSVQAGRAPRRNKKNKKRTQEVIENTAPACQNRGGNQ